MSKYSEKYGIATCCLNAEVIDETVTKDICSKNDVVVRYRLQKLKLEAVAGQKNAQAEIEFLKQELQKLAIEIQQLKGAINGLAAGNFNLNGEITDLKQFSDLLKIKSRLKVDLTNLLEIECSLKRRLDKARTSLRNTKLDELLVDEDIKRVSERCWEEYVTRQAILKEGRLGREEQSTKNAIFVRRLTITSVSNSLASHVLRKLPSDNILHKKLQSVRSARKSLGVHVKKAFEVVREENVVATTEYQLRNRRRIENLLILKNKLIEIGKSVATKNNIRRLREEEISQQQEEVKEIFSTRGANPYVAEYIMNMEEKHRNNQRKMLIEEQKKLYDMQREYALLEAAKSKNEIERKKWDDYWRTRAKEKVTKEKKEKQELYFGVSDQPEPLKLPGKERRTLTDNLQTELDETSTTEEIELSSKLREKKQSITRFLEEEQKVDEGSTKGEEASQKNRVSTRRTIKLQPQQRDSLMQIADETNRTVLMNGGKNTFDFGYVPVKDRKYVTVSVANIGSEPVKLAMSALNPYGPFTFCNSLREIPPNSYYSLKFKYMPTESGPAKEIVKIEEIGKPGNFFIVTLQGHGMSVPYSAGPE